MKQFFGAFFGSIIGLIMAGLLMIFITIAVVKSGMSSTFGSEKNQKATENSILKIKLKGNISERELENPFAGLGENNPFGGEEGLGLNALVDKINSASSDKNIKGIYLNFSNPVSGFATNTELRSALEKFKLSGKFIYSYSEAYSQEDYHVASISNKIFLNPTGDLQWEGLGMTLLFLKNTFEKLEIDMQIFRHGKYKSAIEPFILDKMSAANRLQSEEFLNSIWNRMLDDISKSRKISKDELNKMANNLAINFPEDAVGKLIDKVAYEDEVFSEIKNKMGLKDTSKIKFIDITKYESQKTLKLKMDKIAVIYANGDISGGEGDDNQIGSDRICKAIREARLDKKIKAIVLRVNSPGGSALASDIIWRETVLAKKAKPFIVSMGNYAASGGYYISCAADKIYAQANTITGSIGVFGLLPNIQKMLSNKFGITSDTVNTNTHSNFGTTMRPVDKFEADYIQRSVEKVYDTFTKKVAEGRKMKQADVDSVGQGRVWTGSQALKINLVDEIGGLNDAVAYAATKAKLKEYKITELPVIKNPLESLLGGNKDSDIESKIIKQKLGNAYVYFKHIKSILNMKGIQARLPFEMVFN